MVNKSKYLLISLFFLEIVTIICASFVFLLSVLWLGNFSPDTPLFLLVIFIVAPLLLTILSAFMFLTTLKFSFQKALVTKLSFLKKSLLAGYILIGLTGIGFTGFIVYNLFNEPPPHLFPLDDPQAIYKITKKDDFYWISFKTVSDKNKSYVCSWEGRNRSCRWELNQKFDGYIASSEVDLAQFLDTPLKISGKFVSTKEQCIAGNCKSFGTSVVGLKLSSVNILSNDESL